MTDLKKNLILISSLGVLLLVLGFFLPVTKNQQTASLMEMKELKQEKEKPFTLNLKAKIACVFDLSKNKFVFKLNAYSQFPLASLTKLMTALVAREYFPQTTLINISQEAILTDGDNGLQKDEIWILPDIMDVMLISSSNDAAFAIANSLPGFLNLMNKKARELNLYQTYFANSTGLDNISAQTAGGYGSCSDMVVLMKYILEKYPNLLEITTEESIWLGNREFKNTNKLLSKLPSLLAGKTGWDELGGGNLIVVVDKGLHHPIIIAILGSTRDGRFEDVEKLYNHFVK